MTPIQRELQWEPYPLKGTTAYFARVKEREVPCFYIAKRGRNVTLTVLLNHPTPAHTMSNLVFRAPSIREAKELAASLADTLGAYPYGVYYGSMGTRTRILSESLRAVRVGVAGDADHED